MTKSPDSASLLAVESWGEDVKVLLVEDEDLYRTVLLRRLRKRGLDVRGVGTAEAALEALEVEPVDVVVMDVKMPGMNGIEALESIKERHDDIEVLMLTGVADPATAVRVLDRGAFAYLMKPVRIDVLISEMEEAHDQARARRGEV